MNRKLSRALLTLLCTATLVLVSCATQAHARSGRQRAIKLPPPSTGPAQWDHDWSRGAVYYEIFVRSFQDSNGNGVGDLNGLIQRLDYLNDGNPATTTDLGVDALWLMPVFDSPSYHGYDTIDYETINPDYGTNEDFAKLLDEAHRRGIRVIVDLVANHSSNKHPWFLDSASSPTSAHRDWYVWSDHDLGWTQPWGGTYPTWHALNGAWYYGVFWSGMPDLNYRTPAVREEMKRIAKLWLARGVDGFRLDATRHLIETGNGAGQSDSPETHGYLKELAAAVREEKPTATLVGENWTETEIIADYFGATGTIDGGDELPMNFNFPLAAGIVSAVNSGSASEVASVYAQMGRAYPDGIIDAPFMTNHDQVRLATQLGNSTGKMRNAASVLLTLPGAPFLYYGEEVGIQNGPTGGDESKRTPMPWSASAGGGFTTGTPWFQFAPGRDSGNVESQQASATSLRARYRDLIDVRHRSLALSKGAIEMLSTTTGNSPVLAYVRSFATERVLVVHNLSDSFVSGGPLSPGGSSFLPLFKDASVGDPSGSGSSVTIALPPRTTGIWMVK